MKRLIVFMLLTLLLCSVARSQQLAVKTNLLYGGLAKTPNIGMEFALGKRWTLDVSGGYNPDHT